VGVKGVGQMHADLIFMDGGLHRNQPGHGIGRLEPRYRFAEGFHDCVQTFAGVAGKTIMKRHVEKGKIGFHGRIVSAAPLAMAGLGLAKLAGSLWS
jgi:hypothetical protein